MWNYYYRSPRLLVLTVFLIVVAGLSAVHVLPRKEDPSLTQRFAIVFTRYPGAGAEQVESQVTEKVEEALQEIEEVKTLFSQSRNGISVVNIELKDDVYQVEPVWSRARDKLADVVPRLPSQASEPELDDEKTTVEAYSMIVALTWTAQSDLSLGILKRYAEILEDRFIALPGTRQTQLFGAPEEEILVQVDADQLASMGLTAAELSEIIARQDAKAPAGRMRSEQGDLLIEVEGEFNSLQRIESLPVRRAADGRLVRLGHIAEVRRGIQDPPQEISLIAGQRGITVSARVEPDYRIDLWAADARAMLEDFQGDLPRGIQATAIFDQSGYVRQRLAGLALNLFLAGGLVILVVCFMMGWRAALVVGTALPLVCMMVLAGLRFLGVPLHQMSVTGLVIALGLLIDNAIIVVDEIRARLRRGFRPSQAVARSVRHLSVPLLGSTLTTVLAFTPLIIMPGPAGEFVGSIGLSVILALVSSLLVSLTVVAAFGGRIFRSKAKGDSEYLQTGRGPFWKAGFENPRLTSGYRTLLLHVFRAPWKGIVLALLLPLLGLWKFSDLQEEFFPAADRKEFEIQMRMPFQSSIGQTARTAQRMRDRILEHPRVEQVHWFVGSSAPKFYYNMLSGRDQTPSFAQALVELDSAGGGGQVVRTLQERLSRSFPQAEIIVRPFGQGPPVRAPIELRLYGPDLDRLYELGEQFRRELVRDARVTVARTTLETGTPQLWLSLDEEQVRLAGLDSVGIAQQLQTTLEGSTGGSLIEGTEELPVRVRVSDPARGQVERIASLEMLPGGPSSSSATAVGTAPGRALSRSAAPPRPRVPVSALGEMRIVPQQAAIDRRQNRRVNTVQGWVDAGVLPSQVLQPFQERIRTMLDGLPEGYSYEYGGETRERNQAVHKLMASAGVLLVMLIATLVLSFNSFRLAAAIMAVAASSVGLALLSLWVFGYPFGFMAIVGSMGLVGVAVNDSIVVLAALRASSVSSRQDVEETAETVMRSSRHVLTTTLTTMAGFLPLIIAGGRFWPPLAMAIAGGILGATLLALFFIPSAYLLLGPKPAREAASQPTSDKTGALAMMTRTTAFFFLLILTFSSVSPVAAQSRWFADQSRRQISVPDLENLGDVRQGRVYLSERQAVEMALRQNLDLNVQRHRPLARFWDVEFLRGAYDPAFLFNFDWQRTTQPTASILAGGDSVTDVDTAYVFGYEQEFSTGTRFEFSFNANRNTTTNTFADLVPALSSDFSATLRQNLLRGFGRSDQEYEIEISSNNLDISRHEFETLLSDTVLAVQEGYWELQFALEDIRVQEKSLELAQTILEQNQARFEVGSAARVEVIEAEAEVAARREQLIRSRFNYRLAQDELIRLITGIEDPRDFPGEIAPSQSIYRPDPVRDTFQQLMARAREKRPELAQAGLRIENSQVSLDRSRNRLRPQLDLLLSYQQFGLGGRRLVRDFSEGFFDAPVVDVQPGGLGDSLEQLFGTDFYGYVVALDFRLPLGNKAARAENAQAQIALDEQQLARRSLEQQVALEIRRALTEMEMNAAGVEAAQAAVRLSQERLDSQQARFDVGMATTRDLIEAQRDLIQAESVLIRDQVDFIQSRLRLHRALGTTLSSQNITLSQALAQNVTHHDR
ncbi:MAG TPA: efflux RND transporter permease subunit [Acidobacteriota bacterium]|nr:efflux RND transporter permease subunit [Acidobacteriota bacterium]